MPDSDAESLLRPYDDRYDAESGLDGPLSQEIPRGHGIEGDVVPETASTGRRIGWASAYILVISRVIGSGIFAMPGTIVQNVGSPGLALTMWLIGALVAWASLAIDLEYGCMLPRSGGIKVYLEYTYRRPRFFASTLVAVQAVLLGFTAANCIVFAKYLMFAIRMPIDDLSTKLIAVGLLTAITIVHGCFYKTGVWVQNVLGWVKVALIIFMIGTGLFVIILRPRAISTPPPALPASSWDEFWSESRWTWSELSTAFLKIFYSYAGLGNLNNVMNEIKNPVKTLKSVGPTALLTACVMYMLANIAYLAVVPLEEIKHSKELIAALFFERVFGAGFGNVFLPIAIALSAAGNVMVVTFSLARLNQEIARQGFLPYADVFASSKPFGAPMGGLLIHYVPSILVITLPPSGSVYAFIAEVEGYAGQFFAIAIAAGLLLLRVKKPDLHRPFKAWLPVVWLRIALCLSLLVAPLFPYRSDSGGTGITHAAYALVGIAM
ncbi:hypothetical protein MMC25_001729 [Agyrium rufum]|nr:hypothetical protein [Agyrium rufum]